MILMENALKYSPDQSPVDIWYEQAEKETSFYVLDRGPGIPADDAEKVFNRFYQVDDMKHRSQSGLGLGLLYREIHRRNARRTDFGRARGERRLALQLRNPPAPVNHPALKRSAVDESRQAVSTHPLALALVPDGSKEQPSRRCHRGNNPAR